MVYSHLMSNLIFPSTFILRISNIFTADKLMLSGNKGCLDFFLLIPSLYVFVSLYCIFDLTKIMQCRIMRTNMLNLLRSWKENIQAALFSYAVHRWFLQKFLMVQREYPSIHSFLRIEFPQMTQCLLRWAYITVFSVFVFLSRLIL